MSIRTQILGKPGADNATLLKIDSGSAIHRLLFDCGERCLDQLGVGEIQSIDHLFFSHFHMDHVCGFDSFFRHNYNRPDRPVTIWGPPGTIDIIHHRMLGFSWNLHHDQNGEWIVNELDEDKLTTSVFYTREAFEKSHRNEVITTSKNTFLETPDYRVSFYPLNHGSIPSLAYRIDEPTRENIDPEKLASTGLKPGPWLREIKETIEGSVEIEGKEWSIADLRSKLLEENAGDSAAYLTDFILIPKTKEWNDVCAWLKGVNTLVCEAQYRESDEDRAEANHHMTTCRVAQLARDSKVKTLILQHISRRYEASEWTDLLGEAQSVFPATSFPDNWNM